MRVKKEVKIIQDLYLLKKIIQAITEENDNIGMQPHIGKFADDAYSIVINLIGELEEE